MDYGLLDGFDAGGSGADGTPSPFDAMEPARYAMGDTRRYAERMDLIAMTPRGELASTGFVTGGSARNWKGYGSLVDLTTHGAVEQAILTDPQTSGGLLVACAPEAVDEVLECFQREGFQRAAVIGEIEEGSPAVTVV